MNKQQPWYVILKRQRLQNGWSQAEFAEKIGSDAKTVSRWERGQTQLPGPYLRKQVAQVFDMSIEDLGFLMDQELRETEQVKASDLVRTLSMPANWGEAPHIEHFLGRERELETISHWIQSERCRLVVIQGLGGMGKTTLATRLANQLQDSFRKLFWFSLRQAPTFEHFLDYYLQFVFQVRREHLPREKEEQLSLLLTSLQEQSCLIVLDNFESILSTGQGVGRYLEGYEDYGRFLQLIAESEHASCLLLTSREKPGGVTRLEGKSSAVRTLHLAGIERSASQELLKDQKLYGSEEAWERFVHFYSGNPLAMKLVAEPILRLFGGDIAGFLQEEEPVFRDIALLLEEQFERLGHLEQEVMYWLAVEREAVAIPELRTKVLKAEIKGALLDIVESLRQRSLIELLDDGRLTLQPVVMDFVSRRFREQIVQEISDGRVILFDSHPLIQAEAKDYVRINQEQFVLKSVADRLTATFGKIEAVRQLQQLLNRLRTNRAEMPSYAAGNILNLLVCIGADLRGADFSSLTVRQAYLQHVELIDMNFSFADLATSIFADTFSSILCVALSANGKLLAAGTTTGEVRIWQAEGVTPLFICPGHADGVRSVAFSPDGRLLVSGSEDFTLRIWDTSSGQCVRTLSGHSRMVRSVAFSPDGWTIASGSDDKTVRLWDAVTGRCLAILDGHTGWVRSISFSVSGDVLATGSEDTTIRLWDTHGQNTTAILYGHQAAVRAIAYSPVGTLFASGSDDMTIHLWDAKSGKCIRILQGSADLVRALAFTSDGKLLAGSSDDQTITLWDIESGGLLKVIHTQSNRIWSLAFSPDSSVLISASESASEDDTLRYWDVRQGRCIRKLRGYCNLIKSVAFSPDGNMLVSGSEEADLRLWDVASGRCLSVLRGHQNRVRSVAFSPDGKTVASGSEDETICIWDVKSGRCLRVLRGHSHLVRSIIFSPDGNVLASGSHDRTIRLWDVQTGRTLKILRRPDSMVWSVAFDPRGNLLASGNDDSSIYLWDITTGTATNTLRSHTGPVWSVSFSPDGRTLASASDDTTLRTWDIHTGRCLHTFAGHTLWVRSVAFDPNGDLLASGSHDHTVRIWNAHTGHCLKTLQGHKSCVWSVAFSSDGRTVASCGDDGTIRLWNVHTGVCINILQSEQPYERMNISHARGLTPAQKAGLIALGAFEEE